MECHETQESILDALDVAPSAEQRRAMESHLSSCATCTQFAARQVVLDASLASALVPPLMAPLPRLVPRARLGHEAVTAWRDTLPDVVHFVSFAVATLVLAWILPISSSSVACGGLTVALLSYVALSVVRGPLES